MAADLELIQQLEQELETKLKQCEFNEIKFHKTRVFSANEEGNVTSLKLDNLQLIPLPGSLSKFQYLKALSLNATGISDISFLKGLSQLTDLNLSANDIEDISPLQNLKHLTDLNLSTNAIEDISPLQHLKHLTHLDLSFNSIKDISLLQGLNRIIHLNLNINEIADISFLQRLDTLKGLYLRNNKITEISYLQHLKNLTVLDLTKNKISELPGKIIELQMEIDVTSEAPERPGIYLHGNSLEKPPLEIVKKGKEAIRTYTKSLEGERKTLNEVKVLLVGDGAVGKTSLLKRLMREKFNKNEPQTHGINIKPWEVQAGKDKIKAHLWDFGGQEIMHATHQFFLSKRSLYILVLDGRRDEKTEYWLKHIQSFGGDSSVLIVMNKIDENPGFDVNRPFLKEKYPNIKGFFRISCATTEGIEDFSKCLVHELAKIELLRTTWAYNWLNIKTQLENMTVPFISYEQYKRICEGETINDQESQDTLVDFLNDLGVVLHFKDFELLDTYILEPKWVTAAVYKIINSREVAENKGLLHLISLDKILEKKADSDYDYPRDKYRYIIALMKKFELCYGIDEEIVLIPDLLQVGEPEVEFDYETAMKFIIQYDFLPRSVMPRFIVNMHPDIKDRMQWRTGVVLEDKAYESTAIVKVDHEARRICIYVAGVQKRDYFSSILAILRRINKSYEKLKTTELIPMPDDPDITVNYKHLIRLEEEGIELYLPGESDKKYRVKDLLGTIREPIEEDETLQMLRTIKIAQVQRKKESTRQNREKNKE